MKKLLTFIVISLCFSCELEKVEKPEKLQCSLQLTTLLLPVGNSTTKVITGVFTPKELSEQLKGYDMYLINCVEQ